MIFDYEVMTKSNSDWLPSLIQANMDAQRSTSIGTPQKIF